MAQAKVWAVTAAVQVAVAERLIVLVQANSVAATAREHRTVAVRVASAAVREVGAAPFKASIVAAARRAAPASGAAPAGEAVEAAVQEVEEGVGAVAEGAADK